MQQLLTIQQLTGQKQSFVLLLTWLHFNQWEFSISTNEIIIYSMYSAVIHSILNDTKQDDVQSINIFSYYFSINWISWKRFKIMHLRILMVFISKVVDFSTASQYVNEVDLTTSAETYQKQKTAEWHWRRCLVW